MQRTTHRVVEHDRGRHSHLLVPLKEQQELATGVLRRLDLATVYKAVTATAPPAPQFIAYARAASDVAEKRAWLVLSRLSREAISASLLAAYVGEIRRERLRELLLGESRRLRQRWWPRRLH
ncbi:MAG TPA: hypothetical protein VGM91_15840 [Conexibacter sp.]|jgi:hypothetical protein